MSEGGRHYVVLVIAGCFVCADLHSHRVEGGSTVSPSCGGIIPSERALAEREND